MCNTEVFSFNYNILNATLSQGQCGASSQAILKRFDDLPRYCLLERAFWPPTGSCLHFRVIGHIILDVVCTCFGNCADNERVAGQFFAMPVQFPKRCAGRRTIAHIECLNVFRFNPVQI